MSPPPVEQAVRDLRVGPAFDRLRASLDNGADPLLLRSDPTALAPESLLVFDVSGPIRDFARAAEAVAGLGLIAEEETGDGDEEGLYYLFVPNGQALAQIERLYALWKDGRGLGDFARFAELFACLRDLRRWSAQDRVNAADAIALQDLATEHPNRSVSVEIELVFHADDRRAAPYEEEVTAAVRAAGGHILDRGRHVGFASHALLAALPASEVLAIAQRRPGSLADLHPVFSIGPQASLDVAPAEAGDASAAPAAAGLPAGEPVVALFDAVPLQAHARLAGRLAIDDPEDLESLSVGLRLHGTAMASLIAHGDLNRAGEPVRRPIYVRPLLYAPIPGDGREVFHPDRLVVDAFYDAVVRMKVGLNGEPPLAPSVVVVNVSLGDNRRRFSRRLSRWARALDDLAARFGILFVVSAGNLDVPGVDDIPLPDMGGIDDLLATDPHARMNAFLGGLRDDMRDRGLLAPAESVNALTVGSAHDDAVSPRTPPNGATIDPYPEARLPNLTSAPGPGFSGAVKPDVLLPGGRERVVAYEDDGLFARARPASALAGLRVAGPARLAQSFDATTFTGQTSAAAALATRTAHRIHDALEDAYGDAFLSLNGHSRALILKALLVHRARWSPEAVAIVDAFCPPDAHWTRKRAHASRLLGNGFLDMDEAVACASNRATAWATASLECGRGAVFELPMPASLGAPTLTPHAITVTLAWFSPTLPGRRTYRQARFKIVEPAGEDLGRLGIEAAKGQPASDAVRRGTVAQRVFSGDKAAALRADDRWSFKVQREADSGGPNGGSLFFAVAVTVEAEGNIPVYDEVLLRLAVRPRVAIPS